ncbi:TonB family protein [Phenylobacterium sp.]|uniref:TonB family protein n=1 Tax=Phenylobacterium sp. TaxID=1871053 RepID=UPI003566647A
MRRLEIVLAASLLALAGAGRGWAAAPTVITNPDWLAKPTGEAFANAYPPTAVKLTMPGRAIIACGIDEAGRLQDCAVVSEAPQGLGFGQAALSLAGGFLMRPMTVNGQPIAGGRVRIPIRFVLPPGAPPFQPPPPTSSRALALAQELMQATKMADAPNAYFDYLARDMDDIDKPDLSPEARGAIAAALRASYPKRVEEAVDRQAALYAGVFDATQLETLLRFQRSPAGVALNAQTGGPQAILAGEFRRRALRIAQADFCSTHTCLSTALPVLPATSVDIPQPEWAHTPTLPQVWLARPDLAKALNLPGEVRLVCVVVAQGAVAQCRVDAERPTGLGLGTAARSLAPYYRLGMAGPQTGKTVAVMVGIPASESEVAVSPSGTGAQPFAGVPPRSPESLVLARALVAAMDTGQMDLASLQKQGAAGQPPPVGVTRDEADAVIDVMGRASREARAQIVELQAALLTVRLTDAELTEATRSWRSPLGAALRTNAAILAYGAQRIGAEAIIRTWADAGRVFCEGRDCPGAPGLQPASGASAAPSTRTP